ncbi:MAG TPA: flagellar assembly protein FliH [Porticoccaceae bacterium]|nr:flagellar assembly protein FliH [Porticoccaceae bacterium]
MEAQARQRGFEAGRLEGLRAGEAEIKARIDRFEILLDNMVRPFEQVEEKVQQELVLLAGAIAEKLVKHELSLNPDLILETIHEAVGALSANARRVSLRLHPEDIELVNLEGEASTGERHWILIEDPHLSRGECLIESDLEFVDASTTARLNELLKQFLNIDTPTPARWPDGGS